MSEAIHTGQPYHTSLDPLPGPPIDAAGRRLSLYELDPAPENWPSNLHPPNPEWDQSLVAAWFRVRQKQWVALAGDQLFPWDGREAFVYALIPSLVQARPGRKFEFYRNAAVLASLPESFKALLVADSLREDYRREMTQLNWLRFPQKHALRSGKIRDALQRKGILQSDPATGATIIHRGSSRSSRPMGSPARQSRRSPWCSPMSRQSCAHVKA